MVGHPQGEPKPGFSKTPSRSSRYDAAATGDPSPSGVAAGGQAGYILQRLHDARSQHAGNCLVPLGGLEYSFLYKKRKIKKSIGRIFLPQKVSLSSSV